MLSNQLHNVGGPMRNEVWGGSTDLLKICDTLLLVAPQTNKSNYIEQSDDMQRKNIWKIAKVNIY